MDPELIAFLKAEFSGINARLDSIDARLDGHDARFDGVDARFDGVDARFDGIDARFDSVDARFDSVDARFDGQDTRFDGIDRRLDKVEEQNRHTHMLIEDLQSKAQLLAEGHAAQDEKIDRRFDEAETGRKENRGHLEAMLKGTFLHLSRRDDELEERTVPALRSASD